MVPKTPMVIKKFYKIKIRYNVPILKYTLPSAKFFLEHYDLCQGNGDRRNKSVHLFMPKLKTK